MLIVSDTLPRAFEGSSSDVSQLLISLSISLDFDTYSKNVINSRTAIAGAIIGLLFFFLQFKEFELYWGAVFFKICSHVFMIFEVKLE